jgi:hypothetical protein
LLLLIHVNQFYVGFPRRFFASEEDWQAALALAASKIAPVPTLANPANRLFVASGAIIVLALLWMTFQKPNGPTGPPSETSVIVRPATADDRKSMMRVPIADAVVTAEDLGYLCSRDGLVHDATPRGETTFECWGCQLTIEERGKTWTLSLGARGGIVEQLGASEYDLAIADVAAHGVSACSTLLRAMQGQAASRP